MHERPRSNIRTEKCSKKQSVVVSAPFAFSFTDSDHRFPSNNVQLQNTLFMISFFISCCRSSASLRKFGSGLN